MVLFWFRVGSWLLLALALELGDLVLEALDVSGCLLVFF
jgi:hypothetical protein